MVRIGHRSRFAVARPSEPRARLLVGVLALWVVAAGVRWGTFVAGGADAYGYVSQAELWRRGALRLEQQFARTFPWPHAPWTFAPLGYRPAPEPGYLVPVYAPGLPLLMAGAQGVGGTCAAYYVVPLAGGLAVVAAFLLARALDGTLAGVLAAFLVAVSPAFLAQVVWPMSDVPAAAAWVGALAAAARRERPMPLASGLLAGLAVLVRPNLVFAALPFVVFFSVAARRRVSSGERARRALLFALGLAPAVAAVAAINAHLHGAPWRSGYGSFAEPFDLSNLPPNLRRYPVWALEAHAATAIAAVAAWVAVRRSAAVDSSRRAARLLVATVALVVLGSYLLYRPFDAWWYLRFILTTLVCSFVFVAGLAARAVRALPAGGRRAALAVGAAVVAGGQLVFAAAQGVFGLREGEHRYLDVARAVATITPPEAVIVSTQHSGSLRFYAGRLTLRFELLGEGWLDRAVEELERRGRQPYFVLEDWEESWFRARFAARNRLGRLDWSPLATLPGPVPVRLYDPRQRGSNHTPATIPRTSAYECRRLF
jgi:hypothetical protein